jgi:hypothetical protein
MAFAALVALGGAALSGFFFFAIFTVLGCIGYDCDAIPCEPVDDWISPYCGCEWVPPSGVGDWMWVGTFQAASLGLALVLVGVALALIRKLRVGVLGIRKTEAALIGAAWAIGVATTAAIDLVVYIDQWVEWAHFRVDEFGEAFAYPTGEVRAGVLTAGVVVVAAVVAFILLRWRRGRTSQTPSVPEA